MSLSLRWRLALWIAVTLVVTLLAVFIALRFTVQRVLNSDLDGRLSDHAGQISAQVVVAGSLDSANAQELVDVMPFPVVIRDADGSVRAATVGLELQDLSLEPTELSRVLQGEVIRETGEFGDEELRFRTSRLSVGRQVVGVVQVGESASAVRDVTRALQQVLLAIGAVSVVAALCAGYWLARRALKPIGEVADVAREIEASDLSRRIGTRGKAAEVQQLADTFDAMLQRLHDAFQQQRNFVLDVSHELRTPLTALRGNLDVLLMDQQLDGDLVAQLERMSAEVARLIRLTSNLLYLAHADVGRDVDRRPVDLETLCLEVCRQMKDLKPNVKLRFKTEDQVTVRGDPDLLKQLVLNLVDNGLKYTFPGGEVTISLSSDGSRAYLRVEDTGPGMTEEEMERIFERYYRGAGSGAKKGSGAGIGLAISDWIARSHGGAITVSAALGKGSVFTVQLPLDGHDKA